MSEDTAAVRGYCLRAGEGEARWWLGSLATIKATGQETGGLFTLVEVLEPEGTEAPLHVHHREDEGFWILEGEVTFQVGEEKIDAAAGSFVYGPRGIPHSYRVTVGPAKLLFILAPAGFEELVRASSEPALSSTLPPTIDSPFGDAEMEQLASLARAHGTELL